MPQQTKIEVQNLRYTVQSSNPQCDFDVTMTFYYDETNNVKKFRFKDDKINQPKDISFILGGLAHEVDVPDMSNIFSHFPADPSAKEVKFSTICRRGELLDNLKSNILGPFLDSILSKNLYLHLSSFNLLFYSLTDIVDSLVYDYHFTDVDYKDYIAKLKDALYRISVLNKEDILELLYIYDYPDIPAGMSLQFVNELYKIIDRFSNDPELDAMVEGLKRILDHGKTQPSLIYLQGSRKHILIDKLVGVYRRQVFMFINSFHHFDNEADIQAEMAAEVLTFNDIPLKNFKFVYSESDIFTQASDVIIGLIGKVSNFVNENTLEVINQQLNCLSETQKENLTLLQQLAKKSYHKNVSFFHFVEGIENRQKWFKVLLPDI